MKWRSIVLYWVLLIVPTLAICITSFRLLKNEQGRLEMREHQAAATRAEGLRDALLLGISAVQDELIDGLRVVPEADALLLLKEWERSNPLIRHAFVWRPDQGLAYPPLQGAYNETERRFVQRYEGLFAGRVSFDGASLSSLAQAEGGPTSPPSSARSRTMSSWGKGQKQQSQRQSPLYESVQKLKRSSRSMANSTYQQDTPVRQVAEQDDVLSQAKQAPSQKRGVVPATGWVPWFTENRLDLLGWVRYRPEGDVYGVEMEMMAVLSRLVELLQGRAQDGWAIVLRNGMGRPIHQSGEQRLQSGAIASASLALDPALPHWRLELFAPDASGDPFSGPSFMLLSGLLLAIFVVAIVSGGGLLTCQLVRTARDARRKTSFVSNVSHELKTPLTSIRMYAELMSEGRVVDADKQRHYLSVIADESQRLTRLVNNVLDFGRLEQGRKKYRLEAVDLGALLVTFADPRIMGRPRQKTVISGSHDAVLLIARSNDHTADL